MKTLTKIFLLLIIVNNAIAETSEPEPALKEYDVEIIIFEDAHARYLNSQTWEQKEVSTEETEELPEPANDLDNLSTNEINSTTYTEIQPEILSEQYKRFSKSKEYEVLYYGSWRQTGLEEKKAFEIDINELKNTHTVTSKNKLMGNFKLVLARYLHFYAELDYQRFSQAEVIDAEEAVPTETPASETLGTNLEADNEVQENYSIDMHRRMRSKELHYIDHPLIGVLIQINPVKKPEEQTKEL